MTTVWGGVPRKSVSAAVSLLEECGECSDVGRSGVVVETRRVESRWYRLDLCGRRRCPLVRCACRNEPMGSVKGREFVHQVRGSQRTKGCVWTGVG
jgi:hypothetical protein